MALAAMALSPAALARRKSEPEPDRVTVQHILIGFRRSVEGKEITRSRSEAKALAYELFEKAKAGADFDALVVEHTDDAPPGIFVLSNFGAQPGEGEISRGAMVAAFGDVGFRLAVGEIGIADWNPNNNPQNLPISPFGWHVIKRLE